MKHLWILNHYALEPVGAGGTRHYSLAKHLRSWSWETSIIASSVELNTVRQRLQHAKSFKLESYDGVEFLWLKTPAYHGNGFERILNILSYTGRAICPRYTAMLHAPDVIIGSSVHPFAAFAAERLARRKKVPFIFEVRDLWPQTLIDMGLLRSTNPLAIFMRIFEKWLYERADRIITLLPYAGNYIEPLGIDPQKISWLPNGVDLSKFPDPRPSNDRDEFALMYFGAHGRANGLENVLNAMNQIKSHLLPKIVTLRLIGDGPQKPKLISLAKKLDLKNVSFEPPVQKKAIPQLASEADGFVFNLINAPVFRYGISSNKLFEFMAAGRPIIFCCNASNNPVEAAEAGLTVKPDDPTVLAKAIEELVSLPLEKRYQMGQRARRYVELNHSFTSLAEKLAGILDRLS